MSAAPSIRDRIVDVRRVRAGDLLPHPMNPRGHPDAQRRAVSGSLASFGQVAPLIAFTDADGALRLVDGHLRASLHPDAEVKVAVTDLSPEEARAVLAVLDPSAALAEVDAELLASLQAMVALDVEAGLLSVSEDLDALLASVTAPVVLQGDPDEIPQAVAARCKAGEVWSLGKHRVMCGDSTSAADVARLLAGAEVGACLTDPPYNVGEDYDDATDDSKATEEYARFSRGWWGLVPCARRIVTPGCSNLAWWLPNLRPQAQGVWTKTNSMTRASASRFNCWEPILFYGCKNTDRPHDVFDFPTSIHYGGAGSGVKDPHPCPKPASFWEELLKCYTPEGQAVYEPFLGSGTALVAGETAGRRILAMEHSPHYCDIALARWELATGQEAHRNP